MNDNTAAKIEHLARWCMAQAGMPSLVINAPEDGDDMWRIYPFSHPAIGTGKSLAEAVNDAMNYPQVPAIGEPLR